MIGSDERAVGNDKVNDAAGTRRSHRRAGKRWLIVSAVAIGMAAGAWTGLRGRDVVAADASAAGEHSSAVAGRSAGPLRWYKGNLHTHSLWSDGDDFPERIVTWYRDHHYDFLAISDHNTLHRSDRWVRAADLKKLGALPAARQYLKDFAAVAKSRGDLSGESFEVRLTPIDEYRPLFDRPGAFLLVEAEEVSDALGDKPVHLCATNVTGQNIPPQHGQSIVEIIRGNFHAIEESGRQSGREVLAHLNHPNFRWGVSAEELAEVVEEKFFEVYNGHPIVNHQGDATHPSVERIWDIANTLRLTTLHAEPLMGLGSDDTHNYHVTGMNRSTAGRGWIEVRSADLSPESLIRAIKQGDFYASSGVVLSDVAVRDGALSIDIEPDGSAEFTTQFIGTLAPVEPGKAIAPDQVGVVLATERGVHPRYKLTGQELYVRATVSASIPPETPSFEGQKKQAWTQPVGWKRVK